MSKSTPNCCLISHQSGLTLIELMVSLVLSLVLMLGALQLFTGSKETYRMSDALARVQENGRFALNLLARDLRQAGYTGCIATPDFSNVLDSSSWEHDFAQPVFGYENGDSGLPDELEAGNEAWVLASSPDALVVLYGDDLQSRVVTGPSSPSPSGSLEIESGVEFSQGQAMLVTDCRRASLFEISTTSDDELTRRSEGFSFGESTAIRTTTSTPGNCTTNLHDICGSTVPTSLLTPYPPDISRVLPLRAHGYYLANTGRPDAAGNPIAALYRQRLTEQGLVRDELLEGVTDLQVLYGVADLDERSAEKYLQANEVGAGEWGQVVAVRIQLTAQAVSDPAVTRDFSTTVAIRNRTL